MQTSSACEMPALSPIFPLFFLTFRLPAERLLPGVSTWELSLCQHTSVLALALRVELTSQEFGWGALLPVKRSGRAVLSFLRCQISRRARAAEGWAGGTRVDHMSSNILCGDKLCRYKWLQEHPLSDPIPR